MIREPTEPDPDCHLEIMVTRELAPRLISVLGSIMLNLEYFMERSDKPLTKADFGCLDAAAIRLDGLVAKDILDAYDEFA